MLKIVKYLSINLSLCAFLLTPNFEAQAECIPGADDPCAPKKIKGAWDNSVSLGFNKTQGNSETTLLNLGIKADKDDGNDIYSLSGAYGFGEDKNVINAKGDNTTVNNARGNGRLDHLMSERSFFGLGTSILYDEMADIDYRWTIDPGLGYYFLKDNSFKFRAEAGPSYVFEKIGNVKNDFIAPRIADRFEWAITCTSKIFQAADALIDIDDTDKYLINAEVGAEAALSTNLALVFTVREIYNSVPAAGKEKDDLQVITAIKASF